MESDELIVSSSRFEEPGPDSVTRCLMVIRLPYEETCGRQQCVRSSRVMRKRSIAGVRAPHPGHTCQVISSCLGLRRVKSLRPSS